MKSLIKNAAVLLAGTLVIAACQKEFKYVFADHGPDVTVSSISESAYMGGKISFSVNISDPDFDLSTIKAELYFDQDVVSDTTIRTKTEGLYTGTLSVPFLANIPDGTATVVFTGTNVGQGQTVLDPVGVSVTRPQYDHLTLTTSEGVEYRMEWTEKNLYSVTSDFDATVEATIEAPAYDDDTDALTFGWSNSEITLGATGYIPFSNGLAGNYTITFNTLTFEGTPFESPFTVNGKDVTRVDADNYYVILDLNQGDTITVEGYAAGLAGWNIDPDWLEEISEGSYRFLAVDGKYRFNIELDNEFFLVERMSSATDYATLNYSDGTGAIWLIGDGNVGKPSMSQGINWTTEKGLCLSQLESGKYQITLVAGVNILTTAVNFKFYSAKGWDGEFGSANLSTDSDLLYVNDGDSDNGNIFMNDGVTLEMGGIYKITLDLTGATFSGSGAPTGVVMHVEQTGTQDIETEDITVNGVALDMVTSTKYTGHVEFTQNGKVSITGISDLTSWYLTPDYLYLDSSYNICFNAVSGTYEVTLYLDSGYAEFVRLNSSGDYAEFSDGGLYLLGWGVAYPHMGNQAGWTTETAPALAQVSDGVFQLTGLAVEETDETMGGAFRYDYISAKYYGQRGWSYESGQVNGQTNTVQLTEEAQKWLSRGDDGNLYLADGVNLDLGDTYRLTIDVTKLSDNLEIIDFGKVE